MVQFLLPDILHHRRQPSSSPPNGHLGPMQPSRQRHRHLIFHPPPLPIIPQALLLRFRPPPPLSLQLHLHTHNTPNWPVTLLSIGGGGVDPTHFPNISSDPSRRLVFIKSVIATARKYGFNGVDLNWEFPRNFYKSGEPRLTGRPLPLWHHPCSSPQPFTSPQP